MCWWSPFRLLPAALAVFDLCPPCQSGIALSIPVWYFLGQMENRNDKSLTQAAHFLRRRDTWIRWVVESDASLVARVVGVHLLMRMSVKSQGCWPNVKTMAKALDISARHAQRGMLELEKAGALNVSRHIGKGNYYSLRLPTDP